MPDAKTIAAYLHVVLGYGALGAMFLTALWLFVRERKAHTLTREARIADLKECAQTLRDETVARERSSFKNTVALKGLYGIIKRLLARLDANQETATGDEDS
jgi:hypothetical protein